METKETKQTKGLKRDVIDKFYTKKETVDYIIELFKQHIAPNNDDLIIEPSAGNGAFIDGIKSLKCNYEFYDLEPEHEEIIKQDYLLYNTNTSNTSNTSNNNKIHILGNPPFGRQSSLAIKFIKKSCQFCSSISFILPKSFKKDSLKKTFPPNFHLLCEIDLPEKSFLVNTKEHDVPCIFQIWIKKTYTREVSTKLEPHNFVFVTKTDNPSISFRRVGVNAGTIDVNSANKSIQSHYFIRFTNANDLEKNIELLNSIIYDSNNTVGPKSIGKQELIKEFNKIL
jgi:predicted RNA methylase